MLGGEEGRGRKGRGGGEVGRGGEGGTLSSESDGLSTRADIMPNIFARRANLAGFFAKISSRESLQNTPYQHSLTHSPAH